MSASKPSPLFLLLLLFFLPLSVLLSTARSEGLDSSAIRSPTDDTDPCTGSFEEPTSCPINCFRPDPVCGVDGVTYWCGCPDAACAGIRVVKRGFCEVGNGGDGLLSGQTLLLVHIVWLIVLGFSVLFGFF